VEVIELDLDGTDDDVIDLTRDGADASAASVSSKVKGEAAAPPHAPQKRAAADADVIVLSDGEEDTVPLALPPPKKEARLAAAAASAGPSAPGLPPPPPPAQSRRARRTAFLNAGPNGPRPVVRLGVRVDGGGGALYDIGSGLSTRMPFVPVQAQMDVMRGVAQALMQGRHALLQSPTGTGKTQALLCATLAFQAFVAAGGAPEDVPVIFLVVRTHAQMDTGSARHGNAHVSQQMVRREKPHGLCHMLRE
jgi:regulator of telomere elongation helicase 1